jgi:hypothetical protein
VYSKAEKPTSKVDISRSRRIVVMRAIPASERTRFDLTVRFKLIADSS